MSVINGRELRTCIFVVSKSRSGLKSIPVGFIMLDEVDEMEQDNIPLVFERAAGQVEKMVWALSTPTIPNYGINKLYRDTSKEHFFFKCPKCSKWIELTFPKSLVITGIDVNDPDLNNSHLICTECHSILDHKAKHQWLEGGKWIPEHTDRYSRGFYINQLYSSTVSPVEVSKSYLKAQRDPTEEQEFWNSKMGKEHIVEGTGITDEHLDRATHSYKMQTSSRGLVTMGIDVGKWIHFEIDEWSLPGNIASVDINDIAIPKVVRMGKVLNFEELDAFLQAFGVAACVIDAHPERRKAQEFAARNSGFVWLCFYGQGVQGKARHVSKDLNEPLVTVDRTSWLDTSLSRFRRMDGISIPMDTPMEYRSHMKALIRVYEKDKNGNPVGRYIKGNDDDHFSHALKLCRNRIAICVEHGSGRRHHRGITGEGGREIAEVRKG